MTWSSRFEDPIALPDGRELVTLEDAARYILTLSDREAKQEHWKLAGEVLIMAAEGRGPLLHARVGMLRAIHHGRPKPQPAQRARRAKAYRIVR
jgi:hypothetical protein